MHGQINNRNFDNSIKLVIYQNDQRVPNPSCPYKITLFLSELSMYNRGLGSPMGSRGRGPQKLLGFLTYGGLGAEPRKLLEVVVSPPAF